MSLEKTTEADSSVQTIGKLLFIIGLAGFMTSLNINFIFFHESQRLKNDWKQKELLVQDLQNKEAAVTVLFQDLMNFSVQYPEVRSILSKHGINLNTNLTPPPGSTPAPK